MDSQQLMFALQSPVGLRFGATIQVDSERVTFEMDLKIPKGTECPFRMELSGSEHTVMGVVRIEKLLPKRGGDAPRYIARIIEMPSADRLAFDGWRRDLATGGVSRRLERDPEALKEQMSSQMMSGLSEHESKAVLDRMNSRRANYKRTEEAPVVDFGLAEESEVIDKEERGKIREQLRSVKEQSASEEQSSEPKADKLELSDSGFAAIDLDIQSEEADPLPTPEPTVELDLPDDGEDEEAPSPSWMPPTQVKPPPVQMDPPAEEAVPPSPPLIVVNADAQPIELTIIYLSDESFISDYERTLHTSAITLDHPDLKELYKPVNVKLQLASGESVETIGHMVAETPQGMAIAMELGPEDRALLKRSAGR